MIAHPAFTVEPWAVRETALHLDHLAQTESVFALANGHLGLRGNLDEGEPFGLPGTYLNGFYELRPLPYAEAGYGNPESSQTIVNVTNAKIIRLLVDDEPFDVRYGQLRRHERRLDLRAGVLERQAEWVAPSGQAVRIASTRLVSLSQRAVAAISYEVEPIDTACRVVLASDLVANEPLPGGDGDPRAAAALRSVLLGEVHDVTEHGAILAHRTTASQLRMAAAMDHLIDGPAGTETTVESFPDLARVMVSARVAPGQPLRIVKFIAYGWSRRRSTAAIRDQVRSALVEAHHTGWAGLIDAQRAYLDDFWRQADVELEGDAEVQQAIRFALFHILQSGARAEGRAIPAKGLTGPGYDGHTFWDTETFVLPVLTYTAPRAARDALLWRHRTMASALERARTLNLGGAAFPWRTIHGEECSGYWPAGTAAFHISADIADAVVRYQQASDDEEFARGAGLELLVGTARMWRSLGHHDSHGRFRIDGVTGPDEYSALADNNVYTNLMAQRNLREAFAAVGRFPDQAAGLGVDEEESAAWRDAAEAMTIAYDAERRVHAQAEAFTAHERWDFANTEPGRYPLLLHFPYVQLYRRQVVKQADLVLAMHMRSDAFDAEHKARNFAYYEALTVRDSSLSACTQAVLAAEVGHLELAYDYLGEAALIDLEDLQHNTRDGLHIASLAGAWIGAVAGFGGLRDHAGMLHFAPRLPEALTRLSFRLAYRGRRLHVEVHRRHASYGLEAGDALVLIHHGESIRVAPGEPVTAAIATPAPLDPPTQPAGRAPAHRRRRGGAGPGAGSES